MRRDGRGALLQCSAFPAAGMRLAGTIGTGRRIIDRRVIMQDDKNTANPHTASAPTAASPNYGRATDPNPGERSQSDQALGVPLNSLGVIPAQGNRAGGGRVIDAGAQVGIMRNLEFTAGGRAHRISTGTYSSTRPAYDPKSGRIHFS